MFCKKIIRDAARLLFLVSEHSVGSAEDKVYAKTLLQKITPKLPAQDIKLARTWANETSLQQIINGLLRSLQSA